VQVDPITPPLKAPETMRLKLTYGELLSNFAFNFNLRRYIKGMAHALSQANSSVSLVALNSDLTVTLSALLLKTLKLFGDGGAGAANPGDRIGALHLGDPHKIVAETCAMAGAYTRPLYSSTQALPEGQGVCSGVVQGVFRRCQGV